MNGPLIKEPKCWYSKALELGTLKYNFWICQAMFFMHCPPAKPIRPKKITFQYPWPNHQHRVINPFIKSLYQNEITSHGELILVLNPALLSNITLKFLSVAHSNKEKEIKKKKFVVAQINMFKFITVKVFLYSSQKKSQVRRRQKISNFQHSPVCSRARLFIRFHVSYSSWKSRGTRTATKQLMK